ncbi:MAG TPA: DUF4139 domain-containing protein [Planctomycetota bacterium]|nr:DUF4139 domain-containing protein [Planctomycetota bacterium]
MSAILDRPTRRRAASLIGLAVAANLAWSGEAGEAIIGQPADIPVKRVVLFSSGVGYFEHSGPITGDAAAELRFKTAQINDVLKSLVVEDRGGLVGTITYPSNDPIAKTLGSFQVNISANPSLGDLLNQLRGARVTVTAGAERLTGTILGLEKVNRQIGDSRDTVEEWRLNLLSGAAIRTVALDEVRGLDLEDAQLQEELGKALAALAQARDQDKKPVVVNFAGKGERDVRLGYVVETPIWKTSYRLIVPADPQAKPSLQGWAIVENQTDNDWADVDLTLVSGRPISFVQDLYQPLYIQRPVVEPELYASLRPQTYDDGMAEEKVAGTFGSDKPMAKGARKRGDLRDAAPAASAPMELAMQEGGGAAFDRAMDPTAGVGSVANAEKIGEFFQYTVGDVSLERQRSAMLPIVVDAIEVERVSIYNLSVLAKNPLLGARVVNTTGKHLLQGPVTVLDSGSYAGDARIDDVPPNQNRLLSFAIDLQVRVDAQNRQQHNTLLTGRISQGVLHLTRRLVTTQEYAIDNRADKDRALIIEHPIQHGWKLIDTPEPYETTERLYRFRDAVKAGAASKLTVKEEFTQYEAFGIVDFDTPTIEFYAGTGELPQPVRDALAKAAQMRRAMDDQQRQLDQRRRTIEEITNEQNRIRQNMQTVKQNTDYYTRLVTKLNDQETEIEKLKGEIDGLVADIERKRQELHAWLAGLELR